MGVKDQEIWRHLNRVLSSSLFRDAPRSQLLLKYLVAEALAGRAEGLKGYTIGVDVFNRGADFDPISDSIVRVQASRLRKLLSTYYSESGKDDPLMVSIPPGGYTPQFVQKTGNVAAPPPLSPVRGAANCR